MKVLELWKAILKGGLGRNEGGGSLRALGRLRKLLLHKVSVEEVGKVRFDCAILCGTVVEVGREGRSERFMRADGVCDY